MPAGADRIRLPLAVNLLRAPSGAQSWGLIGGFGLNFQLYTLRSWDGESADQYSPDYWDLDATGVSYDIQPQTTFSNYPAKDQSYPDAYQAGTHPGTTGSAATGDLIDYGDSGNGEIPAARYDLSYFFGHSDDDITLTFTGALTEGWNQQPLNVEDEGWVLDNLSVTASSSLIGVTTTGDDLTVDGDCTLREAIKAANTDAAVDRCVAGSGADTIDLGPHNYGLSLTGTGEDLNATGDLDVTSNIAFRGAGADLTVINGNDLDRVLHVIGAVTVSFDDVTIKNGGGGICEGGGIYAYSGGNLTLDDTVVTSNESGDGGGIFTQGTATLNNSTVSDNKAGKRGGGITNAGVLTLNDSIVSGNGSGTNFSEPSCPGLGLFGTGGLYNAPSSTITLNDSTVSGNSTPIPGFTSNLNGGGMFNHSGNLILISSTLKSNSALGQGGGIVTFGTDVLTNTTISGNSADQNGGAISGNGNTTTLNNSTVGPNSSLNGTDGIRTAGQTNLGGTILEGEGCLNSTITSQGYNLIEDTTGCTINGNTTGNITGSDPLLESLANNGGPTFTHLLDTGSPAINAGSPNCPPPAVDQRGITRPQGGTCDIGAVEEGVPVAVNDGYETDEDMPLSVNAADGVLENDTDPENDLLSAELVAGPTHDSSFTLNSNGSFNYTPDTNFNGEDTFTYNANDGDFDSGVATVTITVEATNDAPTATVLPERCLRGSSPSGRMIVAVGDLETPAGLLTIDASSSKPALIPDGNLVFTGGGSQRHLKVTSVSGKSGLATITVTVSDGDDDVVRSFDVRVGTAGVDQLVVSGQSVLFGLNGDDVLKTGSGADLLCGGSGDDFQRGAAENDVLMGGGGNDRIKGISGDDGLRGQRGDDRLTGGTGADFFSGGRGADAITDFNAAEGDTGTS